MWDAAIVLSEFLAKNDHLLRGKRVLEVGAGLATLSITAGIVGAREVVATDYDEVVLQLARDNLAGNVSDASVILLPCLAVTSCCHDTVSAEEVIAADSLEMISRSASSTSLKVSHEVPGGLSPDRLVIAM